MTDLNRLEAICEEGYQSVRFANTFTPERVRALVGVWEALKDYRIPMMDGSLKRFMDVPHIDPENRKLAAALARAEEVFGE